MRKNKNMIFSKTKKCEYCGTVVPREAKYCDNCGMRVMLDTDQTLVINYSVIWKMSLAIAIIAIVIAVGIEVGKKAYNETEADPNRSPVIYKEEDLKPYITAEQYEKLKFGMTYEEVVEILGREGLPSGEMDLFEEYKSYVWPGKYCALLSDNDLNYTYLDGYALLEFNDDSLIRKGENCITCAENAKIFKEMTDYSQLEAPLITRAQVEQLTTEMSYDRVVKILGGEGLLVSTSNYEEMQPVYGDGFYSTRKYVWRCTEDGRPSCFMIVFEDDNIYEFDEPSRYMD